MAISLEELKKRARRMIKAYEEAEIAVLVGNQSYNIGGQSLTRADLDKIRRGRQEWESKLGQLNKLNPRDVYSITLIGGCFDGW